MEKKQSGNCEPIIDQHKSLISLPYTPGTAYVPAHNTPKAYTQNPTAPTRSSKTPYRLPYALPVLFSLQDVSPGIQQQYLQKHTRYSLPSAPISRQRNS